MIFWWLIKILWWHYRGFGPFHGVLLLSIQEQLLLVMKITSSLCSRWILFQIRSDLIQDLTVFHYQKHRQTEIVKVKSTQWSSMTKYMNPVQKKTSTRTNSIIANQTKKKFGKTTRAPCFTTTHLNHPKRPTTDAEELGVPDRSRRSSTYTWRSSVDPQRSHQLQQLVFPNGCGLSCW